MYTERGALGGPCRRNLSRTGFEDGICMVLPQYFDTLRIFALAEFILRVMLAVIIITCRN
jgi:hypothetical protein